MRKEFKIFLNWLFHCIVNYVISFLVSRNHRPQYVDDLERLNLIDDTLNRLADCVTESPIHSVTGGRSSSRELSGTLKVMKRVEQVFQGKLSCSKNSCHHHMSIKSIFYIFFFHAQPWIRSFLKKLWKALVKKVQSLTMELQPKVKIGTVIRVEISTEVIFTPLPRASCHRHTYYTQSHVYFCFNVRRRHRRRLINLG